MTAPASGPPNSDREGVLPSTAEPLHTPALWLFAGVWVVTVASHFRWIYLPLSQATQDGVLVLSGLVALWMGLWRQVPLQNVVGATVVVGGLSWALEAMNQRFGVPFGLVRYTDGLGGFRLVGVPWLSPVFWVLNVLVSRALARLLLLTQRHRPYFGYGLLVLAAGLVVVLDFSWQLFASRAHGHWLWETSGSIARIRGVPWTRLAGVFASAVVILFAAFPWFVNKKPAPTPLDRGAVVIWWLILFSALIADGGRGGWKYAVPGVCVGLWAIWAARFARPCHEANPPYGGSGLGRVENRS